MTSPAKTQGSSPSIEIPSAPNSTQGQSASKIPKATQKLWNKLSDDLRNNPESNWQEALKNSDELARSVCGSQYIDNKVRAEIMMNINMLEQTLLGLNLGSADHLEQIHGRIKEQIMMFKLDIVANPELIQQIDELKNNPSST